MNKQIYRLDHYYNKNHNKYCLLIETDIKMDRMIKILASIYFKFEELINETISVDEEHLLIILKEFYKVEDVKVKYKKLIPKTCPKWNEWDNNIFNLLNIKDEDLGNIQIIQIDLYEARESCCGHNYKEIMKEVLPAGEKLDLRISEFKEKYI